MADANAKACTKCRQIKPFSDFPLCRGVPRARCKVCHVADATAWAQNNRARYLANMKRAYRASGPKNCLFPPLPAHIKQARIAAARKQWADANVEKLNAMRATWATNNKHVSMEVVRRRQASKRKATPSWANRFFMQEAYHLALLRTAITGIPHDVDHIVPLQSRIVCGLHCESNLQILPRKANRQKANKWWPDMPS